MKLLNDYLRETFGCKVYKIALNAGCTCPNRDRRLYLLFCRRQRGVRGGCGA